MSVRSCASATISFGLISVPVKFYLAAAPEGFSFHLISPKGNRVKFKTTDEATGEEIDRAACSRGYEVAKDQLVVFTDEEIDALSEERANTIELAEFVDAKTFNPVQVEKAYYLKPDKGAEKSFLLLQRGMKSMKKMAIGKNFNRGKDNLVAICPVDDYFVLYQLYYANEVRSFSYEFSEKSEPNDKELNLAKQFIKKLSSDEFDPKNYVDEFSERVRAAIELKQSGQEVKKMPALIVAGKPLDLAGLLEESLKEKPKKAVKKIAK